MYEDERRITKATARRVLDILHHGAHWPERELKSPWERRLRGTPLGRSPSSAERSTPKLVHVRGTFHSYKLNRDVVYDSLTERRFLRLLETCDDVVSYIEQPTAIAYSPEHRRLIGASRGSSEEDAYPHYVPDIAVNLADGRTLLLEVKSRSQMALAEHVERYHTLREYCEDLGMGWLVLDAHGLTTLDDVFALPVPAAFSRVVHAALTAGSVSWSSIRAWMNTHDVSHSALTGFILRENLVWTTKPYAIRRPREAELRDGPWDVDHGVGAMLAARQAGRVP